MQNVVEYVKEEFMNIEERAKLSIFWNKDVKITPNRHNMSIIYNTNIDIA